MLKTRIRELRMAKHVSQKYLADHLGVTVPTVSDWELGKKYPRVEKLPLIASLLGCTINDLFEKEE